MKVGKVVGSVWATKKNEQLNGHKLLAVQLLYEKEVVIASDVIGAGVGDYVLLTFGSMAKYAAGKKETPIDLAIVGIIDSLEIEEEKVL